MNDFTQKINKVNDGARFWLHRCNHFGKHAWKMLGYDYSNNNFSNINGCYISIGCESGKWDYHTVETIRNADVVWMQTNAMPHNKYNKIMEIVRMKKIPVKYFAYASAEKCVVQLAEYDTSR